MQSKGFNREKFYEYETSKKDLQEYIGYYSELPWLSELYISTWEGKLVELNLPAESPANSMTFFKHIENDTFRRIRDDGELGETLVFERDKNGQIIRFKRHGNYTKNKENSLILVSLENEIK